MNQDTASECYDGLDVMPIGGQWRAGHSETTLTDRDPWSGETIAELRGADVSDVDDAYTAAAAAQSAWARTLPEQRAAVMRAAAAVVTARHDELARLLRRESGGTVAKIEIELGVVRAGFLEAAGMPHHMTGRIVPSDIPGKENRVYRRSAGVVCLISPWDFPMYLTNRTLAPALALGNAVGPRRPASASRVWPASSGCCWNWAATRRWSSWTTLTLTTPSSRPSSDRSTTRGRSA